MRPLARSSPPSLRAAPLLLLLAPAAALAHDAHDARDPEARCSVRIHGESGRVESGDVEVRRGDPPGDVIALDGSVRLRAGAVADDVVAVGGDVVVEEGAVVRGSATAVGGRVRAAKGARIEGSASAVGGRIDAPAGAVGGERSSLTVELNGEPLATRILEEVRAGVAGAECDVRVEAGER